MFWKWWKTCHDSEEPVQRPSLKQVPRLHLCSMRPSFKTSSTIPFQSASMNQLFSLKMWPYLWDGQTNRWSDWIPLWEWGYKTLFLLSERRQGNLDASPHLEGGRQWFPSGSSLQYNDGFSDNILSFVNNARTQGRWNARDRASSLPLGYERLRVRGFKKKIKTLKGPTIEAGGPLF